ncbi:MAG TPA: GTP-binding protein [Stellaceae bacterium]|nr:GTP-binding protein [Stellaceae bacterium]
MTSGATALPVNILTGFLGSGKTTLLRRLLASPAFRDTAVLINEFGEVGIDHLLVEALGDTTVLLPSGCICCTIRGDLARAIADLQSRRERGIVPRFRRIIVETTGLADPAPLLATVMLDPVLRHHCRVGNIVATVDGVNGLATLAEHPEAVKQVAVADRLVITKLDLADPGSSALIASSLKRLNPTAAVLHARHGETDVDLLIGQEAWNPEARSAEVGRWLAFETEIGAHRHAGDRRRDEEHPASVHRTRHGADIEAFCITLDRPIEWAAFGIWLTMLLNRHGEKILRIKGIVNILGTSAPVVVQGVQHLVHAPIHLDAWPSGDRRSRLVFILHGLNAEAIRNSLLRFQSLGMSAAAEG